jgi:glycosyltransferase involved in cell wall biosynthesis
VIAFGASRTLPGAWMCRRLIALPIYLTDRYGRRMRVLFYIHELALNGAVTALLQQVRHMRARGDAVTIMTPPLAGAAKALEGAFRALGVVFVDRAGLADHDVFVGCTVFCAEILDQIAGQRPTVWWIHEGRAGVNTVLGRPSTLQTLNRVTKLIFPSRGVVERLWPALLGNLPPGRVEIVPYLIPAPPPGDAVPRTTGQHRIVCTGTIYPRKRQVDLIRAVTMMSGAPIECVLIGELVGLEQPGEQLMRADPGRFVLTGGVQPARVHAWYRAADVFCLPSADECMPIAPVEAAWHGLPVLLADLECYEGVWKHGVNALMHPVGDAEMLAWHLRMLLESPSLHARFSAAARAVTLQFSETRSAAMFDAVLEDAIAGCG